MFEWLLDKGFMPHGHCYFWRPDILWVHVVSDAVIALSYFSIPVTLLYFLRRRPDVPFPSMIVLFALFIVLCGSGHLIEIWTIWTPVYALQGMEKAATAMVSIVTAVAMIPLIPQVLAMRTPALFQKELDAAVAQLRETQSQLVQNEKMASLGALVAGIAHEINTPVGVGVTAASTLNSRSESIARKAAAGALTKVELDQFLAMAQESGNIILKNMQRAGDLIHSFKQIAVDQSSGERRSFGLRAYIDEILLSLAPRLKSMPHTVSVICPDAIMVDSYPGALAQIFTNLIQNSLVHGFADSRKGSIRIVAREEAGDRIAVEYSDDGVGIPAENLPRVFDPFFTTRRGTGGSGLGMHVVYNLVTQTLGGTIQLSSSPGRGMQLRIVFARGLQQGTAVLPALHAAA